MSPLTAHVLISQRCVNNCVFCTVADRRDKHVFPEPEAILRFIEDCARCGVEHLVFSGMGEPTLDPNFLMYLERAGKCDFRSVQLFTNGFGASAEKVRLWKGKGVDRILLSMHGVEAGHDLSVRRKGSFKEAVAALDLFMDAGIMTTVNTCMTRLNLGELPSLREFLSKYPLKSHTLSYPEWNGNAVIHQEYLLDYREVVDAAGDLVPQDDKGTCFVNVPFCLVRRRTLELREHNSVRILDGQGEHRLAGVRRNSYPDACASRACLLRNSCPGFEKRYIASRGWGDLKTRVDSFLERFNQSETIDTLLSDLSSEPSSFLRHVVPEHKPRGTLKRHSLACLVSINPSAGRPGKEARVEAVTAILGEVIRQARARKIASISIALEGLGALSSKNTLLSRMVDSLPLHADPALTLLLQSDLAVLDRASLAWCRRHNIQLIGSLDPLAYVLSPHADKASYKRFIDNYALLCTYGLCAGLTLSPQSHVVVEPDTLYTVLKNLRLLSSRPIPVTLRPARLLQPDSHGEWRAPRDPGPYAALLSALWKCMAKERDPVPIYPLYSWAHGESVEFESFPAGARNHYFVAVGCGPPHGVADLDFDVRGALSWHADGIAATRIRRRLLMDNHCASCPHWSLCGGGCACHAFALYGDAMRETPFCESYKGVLAMMRSTEPPPAEGGVRL